MACATILGSCSQLLQYLSTMNAHKVVSITAIQKIHLVGGQTMMTAPVSRSGKRQVQIY
jgi:hypothetical protein